MIGTQPESEHTNISRRVRVTFRMAWLGLLGCAVSLVVAPPMLYGCTYKYFQLRSIDVHMSI